MLLSLLFTLVSAQESYDYLIGKCVETAVRGTLHCSTRKDLCFVVEDRATGQIRFHCKKREQNENYMQN